MAWKVRAKERDRNLAEATLVAANASTIGGRESESSEAREREEKSRRAERERELEREVVEAVTAAKTDLDSVGVLLVAIDGESEDYDQNRITVKVTDSVGLSHH